MLSTQEAADMPGVSRPTSVKLLESGEIAFTKPGRHRRVQLEIWWTTGSASGNRDEKHWRR
ncbi:excisionase family DNA-binding protein [Mycobacterium malmoense]|uniref:excisionase family DNA-binding protein n=1 Tax=Mycobacterium malmoense TaxID=1780 RepID=UPI0033140154